MEFNEATVEETPNKKKKAGSYSTGLGSIIWEIQKIDNDAQRALDEQYKHRKELAKNWDMYSGFDYGQWEKEAVASLQSQNRHISQFNLIRTKLNGLAGSLLKNPYDIDFVPVDGNFAGATNILKTVYLSDKEMMNWEYEYSQLVLDGLVQEGIEEIGISTQYNELGNISFERLIPGHLVYDPNWKTSNDKDLRKAWKFAFLTPIEIKDKYPKMASKIDQYVMDQMRNGDNYENDSTSSSIPYLNSDAIYGTKYRVIEEHIIVKKQRKVKVAFGAADEIIEIPDGLSDSDTALYMEAHGLAPDTTTSEKTVTKNVYYVRTICPELIDGDFLENKESPIQIGRLPFFIWSSARINGRNSGMVELLADPQITVNKRQSLIDHIISTKAVGGMIIDPEIVDNDMSKLSAIIDNINKPDGVIVSAPGALASGRNYMQPIRTTQTDPEIFNQVSTMIDYIERLTPQTSTMDGMQDSSHETGILFARKEARAEIAMTLMAASLQQYNMNKGEAYMELAKELYADTYREFAIVNDRGELTGKLAINEEQVTNEGEVTVSNSIKALPRFKVVTAKSALGVTMRETNRAINADLLRVMPQTNPISRSKIVSNILSTIDTSERERMEYRDAARIEEELATEQTLAQIAGIRLQRMQTEMQMQQMMNPQPPQPQEGMVPGQEGMPQPQAGAAPTMTNESPEEENARMMAQEQQV